MSPQRLSELLAEPVRGYRNVIEDSFGVGGVGGVAVPEGVKAMYYPVMLRPPAPVEVTRPEGVEVMAVRDGEGLSQAERVIVEGFPRSELLPWSPRSLMPAAVLGSPGWWSWLALHNGEPAAAAVSFDDGRSAGVYWLATMPGHRGAGLASAVMTTILQAHAELPSVLVATKAALGLYERLGYRTVSEGCWYIHPQRSEGRA